MSGLKGGSAPQTNFVTVCVFFSKITTYWGKVRYIMFLIGKILRNLTTAQEFTNSSGFNLWIKT